MSLAPLDSLPDDARVWCFGAADSPPADARETIRSTMGAFLERWTAHRADLRAGFAWLHDRFLVVAVDESSTGASGCSIDALTTRIRELESELGVSLLDATPVWLRRASGDIVSMSRDDFRDEADRGDVDAETRVFDLTVTDLGTVRSAGWEREAGRSWHAVLL